MEYWFRKYENTIYAICRRYSLICPGMDVEDFFQEARERLLGIDRNSIKEHEPNFVYTVTAYSCCDYMNRTKKDPSNDAVPLDFVE